MENVKTENICAKRAFTSIEELAKAFAKIAGAGIYDKIVGLYYYANAFVVPINMFNADFAIEEILFGEYVTYILTIYRRDWLNIALYEEDFKISTDKDCY